MSRGATAQGAGALSASAAGTLAVFTVGGGILVHGIGPAHAFADGLAARFPALPAWLLPNLAGALAGVLAGAVALALLGLATRLRARAKPH